MKEKAPPKSADGKRVLNVRIPARMHAALLKLKEDHGVSVQHFVTRAIEDALEERKRGGA